MGIGWIWVMLVVGILVGAAALVDRRRQRGISVSPDLSGRSRREAMRTERARLAVRGTSSRGAFFGYVGGGDGGGFGGIDGGGGGFDGGGCGGGDGGGGSC